jgi:hypothetical protein
MGTCVGTAMALSGSEVTREGTAACLVQGTCIGGPAVYVYMYVCMYACM